MSITTLTSKGQITIPKKVRDSLGLQTGDRIEFVVKNDSVQLRPITKSVKEVFGMLHKPGMKARTIEQMDEGIRRHFRKKGKA